MGSYTIYGDLSTRETVTLATVLHAKGVEFSFVDESATLAWSLAARAGCESGPYLRTPEGFVLAELHAILDWIERVHPQPQLLPRTPVRRTCARLLEDWLELWLPQWPRRSWGTLERLGAHLDSAGFLLGRRPVRADWILAGWLETEVLVHAHARAHLERAAPRLVSLGEDLLASGRASQHDTREEGSDDAIPISLLAVLEEIGGDYHRYLVANHRTLKDHEESVELDLGLGTRLLPVQPACERRRIELGRELGALDRGIRRQVAEILEPVRVWHALALPPVLEEMDPADPRSL